MEKRFEKSPEYPVCENCGGGHYTSECLKKQNLSESDQGKIRAEAEAA